MEICCPPNFTFRKAIVALCAGRNRSVGKLACRRRYVVQCAGMLCLSAFPLYGPLFALLRIALPGREMDEIGSLDFLFLKMWTPHTAAPAPSCASPRASNSFFLSGSAHRQSDHQCSSAPLYPLAPQIKELQKRTCSRQPAWRARRPKTRGCQVQLQSCQGQKVVQTGQNRLRKQHSYFIRKSPSLSNCFFGHSLDLCSIWHYRTVVGTVHAWSSSLVPFGAIAASPESVLSISLVVTSFYAVHLILNVSSLAWDYVQK